jgi:hypothetical protein
MSRAWNEAVLYVRLAQTTLAIKASERRRDTAIDDLSKAIVARDAIMSELRIHFHEGPVEIQPRELPVRVIPVHVIGKHGTR